MRNYKICLQTLAFCTGVALIRSIEVKDKRQVGTTVVSGVKDHETAETGFTDAVQAGSKYFQYAHVPAKDHYEFGHRRGNDHHFIERHEKAHPHAGEFKTKVRWGDKHGGYGEHYWDYNHAGHDDDHAKESQNEEEYAAYEETKQVPVVQKPKKRRSAVNNQDVEFINDRARYLVENGATSKHGGNYKWQPSAGKIKTKRQNSYTPKFGINTNVELYPEEEGQELFQFVKEFY